VIEIALTRDFRETVMTRVKRNPAFRSELIVEATNPFPIGHIFINHRQAHSGMVFADGKIVEW
jgi:hypothetical protein